MKKREEKSEREQTRKVTGDDDRLETHFSDFFITEEPDCHQVSLLFQTTHSM